MLKQFLAIALVTIALLPAGKARAQVDVDFSQGLFPQLSGFADDTSEPASWSAVYFAGDGATEGRLDVEVTLAKGWHVYSTTQPPGGPLKTELSIDSPSTAKVSGEFTPDREPNRSVSVEFQGLTVEDYESRVTWSAPITLPADFRGEVKVQVTALVCKSDGSCLPVDEVVVAKHGGTNVLKPTEATPAGDSKNDTAAASVASSFRDEDYVVEWRAVLTPANVVPGGRAEMKMTAVPDATYHVYAAAIDDTPSSTNFVITKKSGLKIGKPEASSPIISKTLLPTLPPIEYHEGKVTWTLGIEVPKDAELGKLPIEGLVAYQACTDSSCMQPKGIRIAGELNVVESIGPAAEASSASVLITSTSFSDILDAAAETKWVDPLSKVPAAAGSSAAPNATGGPTDMGSTNSGKPQDDKAKAAAVTAATDSAVGTRGLNGTDAPMSFPLVLLMAFAGGVILNVMPCVLPVVGLKIMSFVKQAGEDRSRVLVLNVVYVLGILSVFAILAGLAVMLSFSWGEQFTYFPVRLGLALALFALALSYLGVWEIPVPGMAAGKTSQQLQSREGYVGAFSKGVFATILATPCSGPLLGYILGLTISLSPIETVIVIMSVGIGMSLPYLIIGAKPSLVSWLPKPGPWMETLKQFLAFLFLGTVAFFFAGFNDEHRVPVFVSLIGVWFGCWIIGLVPNWESINKRVIAWLGGTAAATVIGMAAFAYLVPGEKVLQWEPYNEARLQQLHREGRTVMIDFTAKWCVNCIVNYNVAINTEETRKLVEKYNAVPMLADWTDRNASIKSKLEELQSRSIPVLAVYPGDAPERPIVLRDLVSQGDVLEALRQAGPSRSGTASNSIPLPIANSQAALH